MKINDKIKLPLDSDITLNKLKELVKDDKIWKNNEFKFVNWTIIDIYNHRIIENNKIHLKKKIIIKHRNRMILKNYSEVEELSNYIYETFI